MNYTYQKKAKLVGNVNSGRLWLINLEDDWIHDQYSESYIYYGTIYSSEKPFHSLSTSITGYFQDCDTQKWIKVKRGVALFTPGKVEKSWKKQIGDFLRIEVKTGIYKYFYK